LFSSADYIIYPTLVNKLANKDSTQDLGYNLQVKTVTRKHEFSNADSRLAGAISTKCIILVVVVEENNTMYQYNPSAQANLVQVPNIKQLLGSASIYSNHGTKELASVPNAYSHRVEQFARKQRGVFLLKQGVISDWSVNGKEKSEIDSFMSIIGAPAYTNARVQDKMLLDTGAVMMQPYTASEIDLIAIDTRAQPTVNNKANLQENHLQLKSCHLVPFPIMLMQGQVSGKTSLSIAGLSTFFELTMDESAADFELRKSQFLNIMSGAYMFQMLSKEAVSSITNCFSKKTPNSNMKALAFGKCQVKASLLNQTFQKVFGSIREAAEELKKFRKRTLDNHLKWYVMKGKALHLVTSENLKHDELKKSDSNHTKFVEVQSDTGAWIFQQLT